MRVRKQRQSSPVRLLVYLACILALNSPGGSSAALALMQGPGSAETLPAPVVLPPAIEVKDQAPAPVQLLPGIPGFDQMRMPSSGLTPIELAPPRPTNGQNSAREFVKSLKGNDATFEVVLGQSRILNLKEEMTAGPGEPTIASGDPSIIEFLVVSPRQIRITGLRYGNTDLSIVSAKGEHYSFEVRVVADLTILEAKLRSLFPDASIRLGQVRNNIVVEGEARNPQQVTQIIRTVQSYLLVNTNRSTGSQNMPVLPTEREDRNTGEETPANGEPRPQFARVSGELGGSINSQGETIRPQVINLLRIPTSQQVLLKVQVAELNRTALRRIGANFLGRTGLDRLWLPRTLVQRADLIVSMPKLKTHHLAGITVSMKNLFGVMPSACYGWPKNLLHQVGIPQSIVDITATVKPHLAIVDGIVGMEGDGPIMGTPRPTGILIMGRNLPAVDATAARIMGIEPALIPYLAWSSGTLGPIKESHISQRGELIANHSSPFTHIDHPEIRELVNSYKPLSNL